MSGAIHFDTLIVGGGTAGITVAAQLKRGWFNKRDIAILEPSDKHYYQPLWTLVGAGLADRKATERSEASLIPRGVTWVKDAVAKFEPEQNRLVTKEGVTISYKWLVVSLGLEIYWDKIPGLRAALGTAGVCSNYSYETVDSTWKAIREFKGGTAIFTNPPGAVKCGGAPQKIMYLADDRFREQHVRDKTRIVYASALPNIFAVEPYRSTLEKVVERKEIECKFRHELIEVLSDTREVVLRNMDTQETARVHYDLLHVTPPMGPPRFLAGCSLVDKDGWIDVDKDTLRHKKFENVFALGDCSNLPTSKTGAAIRKQAPVVVRNLVAAMNGTELPARYDGYTSCPLVTGIGKLVLAEFNYEKLPAETFPVDQSKERWSMWLLKRYFLPLMYWHGMLRGRV